MELRAFSDCLSYFKQGPTDGDYVLELEFELSNDGQGDLSIQLENNKLRIAFKEAFARQLATEVETISQ
jgi:hypothetical protein